MHDALQQALIFLAAAVLLVPLLARVKVNPVLAYLGAGLAVGPYGLSLLRLEEDTMALADLGVVFLLFAVGLELSLDRIWRLRRYILGLGLAQVAATSAVIGAVAWAFGQPPSAAIVIGGALALSSTAFVLRVLEERGEQGSRHGRVAIAILLLQDLAVVPLLTLLPLLAVPETSLVLALGLAGLKAVAAVGAILLVGRLLLRPLFRAVALAHNAELFTATVLLVVLATGLVTQLAGLSMALGAFLAGLVLSETEYRHQIEADIRPFRGLLLGLFFMTVGLLLDLGAVAEHALAVALGTLAMLALKAALLTLLCRAFGLPGGVAVRDGLLLAQGGEFAFILFGRAGTLGVLDAAVVQPLTAVVILSMLATPALAWAGRLAHGRLERQQAPAPDTADTELQELEGHVVVAGYGRVGRTVARLLAEHGTPWVALDREATRVAEARRNGLPVFFGDAGRHEVLEAVGVGRAAAAVVTLDDSGDAARTVASLRRHHPEMPVLARARDHAHGELLEAAGATGVVLETAEASLQLGAVMLQQLGTPADAVTALVDGFRHDRYHRLDGPFETARKGDAA